jgi:hypothetical protein
MMVFRILIRNGELVEEEVQHLISGKFHENPGNIPDKIKTFMKEKAVWS